MVEALMKTKPRPYQLEDYMHSRGKSSYAILWEQGLGKSKLAIDTACYLFGSGRIDTVFIVTQLSALNVWSQRELKTHMWDTVNYRQHELGSMGKRETTQMFDWLAHPDEGVLNIVLINLEQYQARVEKKIGLPDKFIKLKHYVKDWSRCLVIVDEATQIKNPDSNRTKAVTKFFDRCGYRRILTGTAVTERPEDCFSLFYFLDKNFWMFSNFFAFKCYYCIMKDISMGSHSFKKIVGYRHMDELRRRITDRAVATRRTAADVLQDLPPVTRETIMLTMPTKKRELYTSMAKEAAALLHGEALELTSALSVHGKLMQISGGVLHMESAQRVIDGANPKLEKTIELIRDNLPNKTIVFSLAKSRVMVTNVIEKLKEEFGADAVVGYTGETDPDERGEVVRRFQECAEVKIFVANEAAARALTLTAATLQVYYSLDYSAEIFQQSLKRADRIGQDRPVRIFTLLYEDTDDIKVLELLESKKRMQDFLLDMKNSIKEKYK